MTDLDAWFWQSGYPAIPAICVICVGVWLVHKIITSQPVGELPTTPPQPRPLGPVVTVLKRLFEKLLIVVSVPVVLAFGLVGLAFGLGLAFIVIFVFVWAVKMSLVILS